MERLTPVEQRAPGRWQVATVAEVKQETPRVKSFRLDLPMWVAHLPGQHYDVRLTAPDGYQAQRSYSVASSPLDEGRDRADDRPPRGRRGVALLPRRRRSEGDQVEVRGPFASYFVWRGEAPALLVGGGSGVVPLMAMLRHRRRTMPELPMRLLYSVRSGEDVIYADELGDDAVLTFTREPPAGWSGHTGRIDADLLAEAGLDSGTAYVCGSNGFVEAASGLLLDAGFEAAPDPHRALRADRLNADQRRRPCLRLRVWRLRGAGLAAGAGSVGAASLDRRRRPRDGGRQAPQRDLLTERPQAGGDPVDGEPGREASDDADEQERQREHQAALAALHRPRRDQAARRTGRSGTRSRAPPAPPRAASA